MNSVYVMGVFDDLRSRHIRFLEEASRLGKVNVLLWSDDAVRASGGPAPRFPQEERLYLLDALRYVDRVTMVDGSAGPDALPPQALPAATWAVDEASDNVTRRAFCNTNGITYCVIGSAECAGFPEQSPVQPSSTAGRRPSVVVTGCYDWFHSGHVRFFEEASGLGDLYVIVGNDANVRLLKGEGHPYFPADERRYVAGSVRFVKQALIASGSGWMDAEPEIRRLHPDIYVVNQDGDRPEKAQFCRDHGLEYVVLKRTPRDGLPGRSSTELRGY